MLPCGSTCPCVALLILLCLGNSISLSVLKDESLLMDRLCNLSEALEFHGLGSGCVTCGAQPCSPILSGMAACPVQTTLSCSLFQISAMVTCCSSAEINVPFSLMAQYHQALCSGASVTHRI